MKKAARRFIESYLNGIICCAKFNQNEKQTRSTHKEIPAVKYALSSFGHILKNQSIQVNINISSACWTLAVGNSKKFLQNIAINVFNFCSAYNIKLIPQWIPREQNKSADHYSRINGHGKLDNRWREFWAHKQLVWPLYTR